MKLAASNLALPAGDHTALLPSLRGLGVEGLEIVPAHTWDDPWNISNGEISRWRRAIEQSGLKTVGLHDLFADRPELGPFTDPSIRRESMEALIHMSSLCRDLGGRTLILGPRWRRHLSVRAAWQGCREFLEDLLPRIEEHGTVLCLAPSGASGDFCTTAKDCYLLANAVDHGSLGLHFGATALMESGEMGHTTFACVRGRLDLFHADEPGRLPVGSSGRIDHADLRRHLAAISYFNWISVVQQQVAGEDPLQALARGLRFTTDLYLPVDTR